MVQPEAEPAAVAIHEGEEGAPILVVDGATFAFTKCDDQGHFKFTGIPNGNWEVSVFDKWNEVVIDGITTPVTLTGNGVDMGEMGQSLRIVAEQLASTWIELL